MDQFGLKICLIQLVSYRYRSESQLLGLWSHIFVQWLARQHGRANYCSSNTGSRIARTLYLIEVVMHVDVYPWWQRKVHFWHHQRENLSSSFGLQHLRHRCHQKSPMAPSPHYSDHGCSQTAKVSLIWQSKCTRVRAQYPAIWTILRSAPPNPCST